MADAHGPASGPLILDELQSRPEGFDFFQAVRWIECLSPTSAPVGAGRRAVDEPLRLTQEASLSFPPAALATFSPGDEEHPAVLAVHFLGLLGPQGPMPIHITEYVLDRARDHGDRTVSGFLSILHHRFLSLFYRAWANSNPVVGLDRAPTITGQRFAAYVGALAGFGLPSLLRRDSIDDRTKLHYSGLLAIQTRPGDGLRALLEDDLRVPVRIEEFIGEWIELPEMYATRLGVEDRANVLGRSAVLGTRAWECQQRFRLVLGPLDLQAYLRLLPDTAGARRIADWVRLYVSEELGWEVKLIVQKTSIRGTRLGQEGSLGRTSWVASRQPRRDAEVLFESFREAS